MCWKFCLVIIVLVFSERVAGQTWDDKNCENQLNLFNVALTNRELWALKSDYLC
jgi:hypothetical protein